MQVIKDDPLYKTDEKQPFCIVDKKQWIKNEQHFGELMFLEVTTLCDKKILIKKKKKGGPILEEYSKDVHKKKLCEKCVKMIRYLNKNMKNVSSPKEHSEKLTGNNTSQS